MGAASTNPEPGSKHWILIAAAVACAALLGFSIWSLARALSNSPAPGAPPPAAAAPPPPAAMAEEEPEHAPAGTGPAAAPAIPGPAILPARPAAASTNRNHDAATLKKAKAEVNRRLVDKLKQYVKDHPNRDNRELEKQIKIRENQGAPAP